MLFFKAKTELFFGVTFKRTDGDYHCLGYAIPKSRTKFVNLCIWLFLRLATLGLSGMLIFCLLLFLDLAEFDINYFSIAYLFVLLGLFLAASSVMRAEVTEMSFSESKLVPNLSKSICKAILYFSIASFILLLAAFAYDGTKIGLILLPILFWLSMRSLSVIREVVHKVT